MVTDSLSSSVSASDKPKLEINTSRQFTAWLAESGGSLCVSTYQAGKIFWFGLRPNGQLSIFERSLDRAMGLCVAGTSLYVSSLYQLWRFENILPAGQRQGDYDALYLPQVGYVTGDLDIHDIVLDDQGELLFVNTLFSCVSTVSEQYSFIPRWKPPYISRLAAEDRCHLNGLTLRDGEARYATAISQTDIGDGWREHRQTGGCVMDLKDDRIILTGLSMPHSPRWYNGKLWLLNSGTGEFGWVDLEQGKFEAIAFCPGYLRGLSFVGDYAVVGLSKPRDNKSFTGLALDDKLAQHQVEARCGVMVIDLKRGDVVHWLRIEGVVEELYDVAVIPGVRCPSAIGFKTDEIRRVLHIE